MKYLRYKEFKQIYFDFQVTYVQSYEYHLRTYNFTDGDSF